MWNNNKCAVNGPIGLFKTKVIILSSYRREPVINSNRERRIRLYWQRARF